MMSRLMLNLQASADPRPYATTRTSGPSSSSADSASLFFTTRISMHPGATTVATTAAWDAVDGARRESAYVRAPGGEGYVGEVYPMQDMHYRDPGEDACAVRLGSFRDVEEGALRGTVGKPIVEEWR